MREDFKILDKYVYLDSACMSLKPEVVINALNKYYFELSSCAGRSSHKLSEKVNNEVEKVRKELTKFTGYKHAIFCRNATEAINIVANNFSGPVLISDKEHNSNLLPWQNKKIYTFSTKGSDKEIIESFEKQISKVKFASFVHMSNVDGQLLPVDKLLSIAKKHKVKTLIDGCQSIPHKIICKNADFLAFSGHKMFGPTGTGVLMCNEEIKPLILGGGQVYDSTYESASFEKFPNNMESGLQDYAGIIGLGAAITYLKNAKGDYVKLNEEFCKQITSLGLTVYSSNNGITSFNVPGLDCHETALMLSEDNILVRSGAHCVHSWYNKYDMPGTVRASFYYYNNLDDLNKIVSSLKKIKSLV